MAISNLPSRWNGGATKNDPAGHSGSDLGHCGAHQIIPVSLRGHPDEQLGKAASLWPQSPCRSWLGSPRTAACNSPEPVEAYLEEITARVAIRPITAQMASLANQLPANYPSDPATASSAPPPWRKPSPWLLKMPKSASLGISEPSGSLEQRPSYRRRAQSPEHLPSPR